MGAFGPLLPEIGRSQSLADWQLGLVGRPPSGLRAWSPPCPPGLLVARRLAATLMAAPLVLVLGLVLLVSAGPLPVLLAGRFLLGVAQTLTMVGGLTAILLEDHGSERLGQAQHLRVLRHAGHPGRAGRSSPSSRRPGGGRSRSCIASTPALIPLLLIPAMRRAFPEAPLPRARADASAAVERMTARDGRAAAWSR